MCYRKYIFILAVVAAANYPAFAQTSCTGSAIFTAAECTGDALSEKEKALFEAVNVYREANGLTAVKFSPALSRLGNRRMLDLTQNMKMLTHSWSNCAYDIKDEATWPCLTASPTRLNTGYTGEGYETLYRTTKPIAEPQAALDAWKKSELHSSIILNKGMFATMPWEEMGVAVDGSFAAVWFGYRKTSLQQPISTGLGVSLDQAIFGLSRTLTPEKPEQILWQATSVDKRVTVTMHGVRGNVSEAQVNVTGKIDEASLAIMSALLKNLFPEWPDIDDWLAASLKTLAENPKGWRRKVVQNRVAEIRGDGNGVRLAVKPYEKPKAIEMD